ncbi:MAG: excinuclease ABC subunit UvrA [Planctomycetota bacterium]|jgi:excinuclease ABC subunit A
MTKPRWIELRGASEHNLRDVDVDIPLQKLTVVCGVSGSGKTSLALDTLFAEGQRRYIESFSAYTRQFLARIEKPRFESLSNLPPSLAMTRGERSRNNRSTVGTASELMEPMRILFSLISKPYCRSCGEPMIRHTPNSIAVRLAEMPAARSLLGFELNWKSKVDLSSQLLDLQATGFIRVVLTDAMVELSSDRSTWASKIPARGSGMVVVERFRTGDSGLVHNLIPAIELALGYSANGIMVLIEELSQDSTRPSREIDGKRFAEFRYSSELRCEACRLEYPEAEPRLFNFNSPIGACSVCAGFGEVSAIDMEKVVPDRTLSLRDGAIAPWRTASYSHELDELAALAGAYGLPMDVPVSKLTKKQWGLVEHGVPERRFGGLDGFFAWLERKKYKMHVRAFLSRWRTYSKCPSCQGARLSPDALAYRYEGDHFWEWCDRSVATLRTAIDALKDSAAAASVADPAALGSAIAEVDARLRFLDEVGLGYLTLNRTMHTLSGGEAQRVQLTTLLGSDLVDMLYVLDEPTVGLHPSDTSRVAVAVQRLVDRGNTVILIEHEPYLLFQADHVIEIGPGAGELGGRICYSGSPRSWKQAGTLTARYLFEDLRQPASPRKTDRRIVRVEGASGRNLNIESLEFPARCLTAVVGVSGSGKSSLVMETVVPAVLKALGQTTSDGLPCRRVELLHSIEGCVAIDQSPIAKSIRSTPATFTKAMDEIRTVFGTSPDARGRGMNESHFSFNSPAGRCPECEGLGFTVVDMQFMADIRMECTHCKGTRYRPEILQIRYRERSIAQVLEMSVSAAQAFFRGQNKVQQRLQSLLDIGLGYLPLGQSLSALSAGESMRLKLAAHLQDKRDHLIIMDEPTTGLHFADVQRLLECIGVLIERGNTLILVEHNEQIVRSADWIIELGPGPGPDGGRVLYSGPRDAFFQSAVTPTSKVMSEKLSVCDSSERPYNKDV